MKILKYITIIAMIALLVFIIALFEKYATSFYTFVCKMSVTYLYCYKLIPYIIKSSLYVTPKEECLDAAYDWWFGLSEQEQKAKIYNAGIYIIDINLITQRQILYLYGKEDKDLYNESYHD